MASMRQLLFQCVLYLMLITLLLAAPLVTSESPKSGSCPDKCCNINIPYPFGTKSGCYRDGFVITCNQSTTPPKAFLGFEGSNIELIDINITTGEVWVYKFIGYRCYNKTDQVYFTDNEASMNLSGLPFIFSNKRNKFTAIGCSVLAYILGQGENPYVSGCVSFCDNLTSTVGDNGTCNGLGCCQTSIPEVLKQVSENRILC